jgi:hypothetical protein
LSKEVRAWLNLFQSASSVFRSSRAAAFHSSSRVRIRSPVRFQSVEVLSVSASATMPSLRTWACARAAWRAASASLRRSATLPVERSEPGEQPVEVTDGVGIGDLIAQVPDRRGRVLGSHATRGEPLFQEGDLALDLVVLAPEVRQRLVVRRPG